MPTGTLNVTVVGANNLRDKDWFGKQDPYVVITYGGTKYRTKTDEDGGKNPKFNERFTFNIVEGANELICQVKERDHFTRDDVIGTAKLHVQQVAATGYMDSPIQLYSNHGKAVGELRLVLHFTPAPMAAGSYPTSYGPTSYGPTPYGAPAYSAAPYAPPSAYPPPQYPSYGAPAYAAPYGAPGAYPPQQPYPPQQSYPPQGYPAQPYAQPPPAGYGYGMR